MVAACRRPCGGHTVTLSRILVKACLQYSSVVPLCSVSPCTWYTVAPCMWYTVTHDLRIPCRSPRRVHAVNRDKPRENCTELRRCRHWTGATHMPVENTFYSKRTHSIAYWCNSHPWRRWRPTASSGEFFCGQIVGPNHSCRQEWDCIPAGRNGNPILPTVCLTPLRRRYS